MRYESLLDTIGNTPLVRLQKLPDPAHARVYVKMESRNPSFSVKDRAAYGMVTHALRSGKLTKESIIVEPTSGNTGIALAMICAVYGIRLILVIPESMSEERRRIAEAFGASLVITPAEDGMRGAVETAKRIVAQTPHAVMIDQFSNSANVRAHVETTAQEILSDAPDITAFVAGVGTGGTLMGVGTVLKAQRPHVKIIAIEPAESAVLSGGVARPHAIQGIGAGFVPPLFDRRIVDEIIQVRSQDAYACARALAREEGILCGISSGANVCGALEIARRYTPSDVVITVICDTGERYLSTELFIKEKEESRP